MDCSLISSNELTVGRFFYIEQYSTNVYVVLKMNKKSMRCASLQLGVTFRRYGDCDGTLLPFESVRQVYVVD